MHLLKLLSSLNTVPNLVRTKFVQRHDNIQYMCIVKVVYNTFHYNVILHTRAR